MTWPKLKEAPPPLTMPGLLAFMERWKPASTEHIEPATAAQISALAQAHGGSSVVPPIYREFLETMGASTGGFEMGWCSTSISDLLEDLEDRRERPDPRRYLKFSIGEDDYNERHPDDFFDLACPTPDGRDAALLRIREEDLVHGKGKVEQPFPTFSDMLRELVVTKTGPEETTDRRTPYYLLGTHPDAPGRAYELLVRLGFTLTELGASASVIPLEHRERGAVALVTAPSTTIRSAAMQLWVRDQTQQSLLEELIADHQKDLLDT